MIPDFRLTTNELSDISVLILPHVRAIDPSTINSVIVPFLKAGKSIIVTGTYSGSIQTQNAIYAPNSGPLLYNLGAQNIAPGSVTLLNSNPGFDYFVSRVPQYATRRAGAAQTIGQIFTTLNSQSRWQSELNASSIGGTFFLTLHQSESYEPPAVFVDILNTNFNRTTDQFINSAGGTLKVALTAPLISQNIVIDWIETDSSTSRLSFQMVDANHIAITIPPFRAYGSAFIHLNQ